MMRQYKDRLRIEPFVGDHLEHDVEGVSAENNVIDRVDERVISGIRRRAGCIRIAAHQPVERSVLPGDEPVQTNGAKNGALNGHAVSHLASILSCDLPCEGSQNVEYSDHRKENNMGGSRGNVRFFLTIPIVILAIAAISYG